MAGAITHGSLVPLNLQGYERVRQGVACNSGSDIVPEGYRQKNSLKRENAIEENYSVKHGAPHSRVSLEGSENISSFLLEAYLSLLK